VSNGSLAILVSRTEGSGRKEDLMALYRFNDNRLHPVADTSLAREGIREAEDLQRTLRKQIGVVSPDTLVISEEYSQWDGSSRRIDLLGLDRDANLVVIELKRTHDGGHMELQALRYAAMVSAMTFDRAVDAYREFIEPLESDADPQARILEFLGWDEPDEERFARDVRIVLVSQGFSKEITTTVMWLNERGLDIRCVRFAAYKHEADILFDVQQVIPLPEATDYQIQIREKRRQAQAVAVRSLWKEIKGKRLFPTLSENPRRPDTHGFTAFQIMLDDPGIVYEDWVERYRTKRSHDRGHPYRHLRWDLERGRVRIQD